MSVAKVIRVTASESFLVFLPKIIHAFEIGDLSVTFFIGGTQFPGYVQQHHE